MTNAAGMPCPVCKVNLVMSERQGVEIDYCPQCRGVWLDRGELDKIIASQRPGRATHGIRAACQLLPRPQHDSSYNQGYQQPYAHGHGANPFVAEAVKDALGQADECQ